MSKTKDWASATDAEREAADANAQEMPPPSVGAAPVGALSGERKTPEQLKAEERRRNEAMRIGDGLDEVLARIEHGLRRIRTGFDRLDRALSDDGEPGGFTINPPSLVVLGAQPKAGKSTFASIVAEYHAKHGGVSLYVDFENGRQRFTTKMLCRAARVGPGALKRGMTELEMERWNDATAEVRTLPLYYVNDRTLNCYGLADLVAWFKGFAGDRPLLVVVDSLQKLPMPMEDRRNGIDGWLRAFEAIRDTGVVVLAISELSRAKGGGYANYKESGGIEYTGDLALQLGSVADDDDAVLEPMSTALPNPKPATLRVLFNRDGGRGAVADYVQEYPYYGMGEKDYTPPRPTDATGSKDRKANGNGMHAARSHTENDDELTG